MSAKTETPNCSTSREYETNCRVLSYNWHIHHTIPEKARDHSEREQNVLKMVTTEYNEITFSGHERTIASMNSQQQ